MKVGQVATVTIEALSGRKVAAHVLSVDQLPASSSGVVSYDVTFQLDQGASELRTGMSATAEVVVKQKEGLSVPTSAISGGSVTVVRGGKHVVQPVTTGLVGNSSTIILSGLKAGEVVALPTPTSTASGSQSRSRTGAPAGAPGGSFRAAARSVAAAPALAAARPAAVAEDDASATRPKAEPTFSPRAARAPHRGAGARRASGGQERPAARDLRR